MSPNKQLMQQMGVPKGEFSPMPPKQHRFFIGDGETARNRLVAYIWEHTITLGHPTDGYGPRSPYCVDKAGKVLTIDDAALYFHWDDAFARKTLRQVVSQGRVKTDKKRRLWLVGEVSESIPLSEEEVDSETEGESKANKKVCTRFLPGYILQKIRDWPPERRKAFEDEEGKAADLRERQAADALALVRAAAERDQNQRLQRWGLPELRKIPSKKAPPETPRTVQVQFIAENLVQSVPEPRTVPSEKAHPVQPIAPFISSELKTESEVVVAAETPETTTTANREYLQKELRTRRLSAGKAFTDRILEALGEVSLLSFLSVVDQRQKAGYNVTTGLLIRIAQDEREIFVRPETPQEEPAEPVCEKCGGTGLMSRENWETPGELSKLTAAACDCSMGSFVMQLREERQAIA